jgi:predicted membrane GTPase involved in stress response
MINPFKKNKGTKLTAQEIITSIKQEVQGGVKMRNEETKKPEAPQFQEVEINLALLNDKLNYLISVVNQLGDKQGVDLAE